MYIHDYSTCTKQELRNKWQEINYKIRRLLAPYRNRNFLSVSEDELQIFRKKYDEYSCIKREIEMEIRKRMAAENNFTYRVSQTNQKRYDDDEPEELSTIASFGIVISILFPIFGMIMWAVLK